jgi:RNA polymerase sigma-70 factor (ECF subfamily)
MAKNTQTAQELIRGWVYEHGDDLYGWALHKTGDRETAEDLVQDTFLAAIRSVKSFKGQSQPKTWLYAILKNKITDHFRDAYRRSQMGDRPRSSAPQTNEGLADSFFDDVGNWKEPFHPADWHEMKDELLDDNEFRSVFEYCMKELPEHWSDALKFKYLMGKDGNVICQELDVSRSNYWQILHRAKVQVRVCLEKYWFK